MASGKASAGTLLFSDVLRTQSYEPRQPENVNRGGFDWGDAGIGAGISGGIALLVAALGASLLISRPKYRRPARRS